MSNDLQSAVERLTRTTMPSVTAAADLRLVLDALAEAQSEREEQSRLLGKSGEREADLLGKLARLAVERDRMGAELKKAHADCELLSGMEQAAREKLAEVGAKWEAARKDSERLDWLEGELEREVVALHTQTEAQIPASLFRLNEPITRARIDAARAKEAP